jgi:hypothetical protein
VFAKEQELDLPLGIHVSPEPQWAWPGRYDIEYVRKQDFCLNVTAFDAVRYGLTSIMHMGR